MEEIKTYNKYDETEEFELGDVVSVIPIINVATRSCTKHFKKQDKLVAGICVGINEKTIDVVNTGIVDVNVEGIICIGDKLTTCEVEGKARAIKYANDDVRVFKLHNIGKVIGLYNDYNKAKVLLNLE